MDRGMVSEKNLNFLRQAGRRYLVGTPKGLLKKYEQELLSDDWHKIREGIEVKLLTVPREDEEEPPTEDASGGTTASDKEIFILCRSQDRVQKDAAIVRRFEQKIEERLRRPWRHVVAPEPTARCSESGTRNRPDAGAKHKGRETLRSPGGAA